MLGFGVFFTIFTVGLTWLEQKVVGARTKGSEHFNTAGRNVKIGLTGSVIVSQWTWAATLLQSSNVAWNFGISGPFWYAAGATIQVLLFGILAIEIKRKCPNAHTMLEIVDARWGKARRRPPRPRPARRARSAPSPSLSSFVLLLSTHQTFPFLLSSSCFPLVCIFVALFGLCFSPETFAMLCVFLL